MLHHIMSSPITERANEIFREVFDNPDLSISEEMKAEDVEGWDSLAHIQLIVALEKEFKIKFKASEAMGLQNIGELLRLIRSKVGETESSK